MSFYNRVRTGLFLYRLQGGLQVLIEVVPDLGDRADLLTVQGVGHAVLADLQDNVLALESTGYTGREPRPVALISRVSPSSAAAI